MIWSLRAGAFLALVASLSMPATVAAQSISGTALYRERVALPPDAILEATLEDVSRADGPAQTIAFTRVEKPGQPPFAFAIDYDANRIDPTHRYNVRARITQAGRLLFTTDQAYPVLTNGAGNAVEMTMRMVQGAPSTAFEDTVWILTHLGADPIPALTGGREANLKFVKADLAVDGSGGCNRLSGRYVISGDRLTLTPMAMTMMACLDGMDVEKRFVEVLRDLVTFRVDGAQLEIFDFSGKALARFKARP